MNVHPVMLRLQGRSVVIIGGGEIAARKARAMHRAGAIVRVVAREFAPEEDFGPAECIGEEYRPEHLDGAWVVFAATNDRSLNTQIGEDARRRGCRLVNCVDQPEDCDFFAAAVIRDGDVQLAISTGGSAPGLASWLKDRLADALPERVGEFAAALSDLRDELRDTSLASPQRMRVMKQLSGEEGYQCFLRDGRTGLTERWRTLTAKVDSLPPDATEGPSREHD
jgi:siroheme synthase-like protein